MSNNFLGLSKNQTDGILNLLQLSLLGNNAGVNVNAATGAQTSNITNLSGSIVPNSNNVMTAAKAAAAAANFYPQSVGAASSGMGGGGGGMTQQSIISQSVNDLFWSILLSI